MRPKNALLLVLVLLGAAQAHDGDAAHNRKDDLIAKLTEALQESPDDEKALRTRGYLFLEQNEYENALADFDHVLRLKVGPKFTESCRVGRAWTRLKMADYKAALADVDPLCSQADAISGAWFVRGELRHEVGDHAGAKVDLDHALGMAPSQFPHGRVTRALVLAALGDAKGARADLDRVLEGNPRDKEALLARAQLLVDSDWEQTKHDLEAVFSIPFAGDDPTVRAAEARIQLRRNGMITEVYKKALELYERDTKAARSRNRRAAIALEAARLRYDMNDKWGALKMLQDAVEDQPSRVDSHRVFVSLLEKTDGVTPERLAAARRDLAAVESSHGVAAPASGSR